MKIATKARMCEGTKEHQDDYYYIVKFFFDFFSFTEFQDSYGSLNNQDKNNGADDQVRFVGV